MLIQLIGCPHSANGEWRIFQNKSPHQKLKEAKVWKETLLFFKSHPDVEMGSEMEIKIADFIKQGFSLEESYEKAKLWIQEPVNFVA